MTPPDSPADANVDTVVECVPTCCSADNPPRYAPTTAGEHLLARLRATHTTHMLGATA